MSNLKRYTMYYDDANDSIGCIQINNGEWVKFEDVKHLLPTGAQQANTDICTITNCVVGYYRSENGICHLDGECDYCKRQ